MSEANTVERKRGNTLGFWFFRTAIRASGLRGAYGLLYFVALHYLIFDRPAVRASLAYVTRRFPQHGPFLRILDVYRLFLSQGRSLIDRYYINAGGTGIGIDIEGYDRLKELLSAGKGLILLTAHVGNWQVAMTALGKMNKTVYLMMRPEDNAAVKASLNIDGEHGLVRILSSSDPVGGVIEAIKAIDRGDLVSIMGDRTYDYGSVETDFFGEPVRFPYGAFSIAAASRCPVVVLLSAKVGAKKYLADVTHVIDPPMGRREEKKKEISACVRKFASILEQYARRHPYQWFVFRDMWRENQ